MSTVNPLAREVAAKIVFYGPGLSGKTTTLRKIYESVKPEHRGGMVSLPTEADRTLFFDFLPVKVERVGDFSVRLALYTVPGQVFYNATRKLVLQGADGVVFVADSQPEALDSNQESLLNLEENLQEQGIELASFPLVMQYNKRDLASALPVEQLRQAINVRGCAEFETCATNGRGVLDMLKAITRLVIRDLRTKRVVPSTRRSAPSGFPPEAEAEQEAGLEDQIQQHLDRAPPPEAGGWTAADASSLQWAATPTPGAMRSVEPLPVSEWLGTGAVSALAPPTIVDHARAAELAFLRGEHLRCVAACQEAVRRTLALTGDDGVATQGYLLGVHGPDLLRLGELSGRPKVESRDAAFALFVAMQVFVRLSSTRPERS